MRSGWLSQGAEIAAFEGEFGARVGAPYACAVSNCTTALHLALLVAGVGPGDEVVTVSHCFIATANVVRQCGAAPIFVDIDPLTYNLDPRLVAGDHPEDPGGSVRPPDRHAMRPAGACRDCAASRLAGHRRRRLRDRERDPAGPSMVAHRSAAWRHGLLLVPSAQGDHHRRGRHADDLH